MKTLAKSTFVVFCLLAIAIALMVNPAPVSAAQYGACQFWCGNGTTGGASSTASNCPSVCSGGCSGSGGCTSFGWAEYAQ